MIKRIGSLFLTVLLLVSLLAACAHRDPEPVIPDTTASPEPVVPQTSPSPDPTDQPDSGKEDGLEPGGWERADSPELTEERMHIFDQAFERLLGADYIPAAYLGKQVVAGTIHSFLARSSVVAPGAKETYALVNLYEQTDGTVRIIDICRSRIQTEMDEPVGGFVPAEDPVLTEELKKGFQDAVQGIVGVQYVPVALCGTKTDGGLQFAVIAESKAVLPEAEIGYSFVYLRRATDGKFDVADIVEFDTEPDQPGEGDPEEPEPTPTVSPSPSATPEATETPSPSPTATPEITPTMTKEPSPVPTATLQPTEVPKPEPTGVVPGEWVRPASPEIMEEINTLFEKIKDSSVGVRYTPVAYLGSQQVKGMNHAVLCETSFMIPELQNLYAIVYVHVDTDGKVSVSNIVVSEVRTYTDMKTGKWEKADKPVVTEQLASLFMEAVKTRLGAQYTPLALLSTQSVSGKNYCFYCETEKVTEKAEPEYIFIYVHEEDGKVSILDILPFMDGQKSKQPTTPAI